MAKLVLSSDGAIVTQRFLDEESVTIGRAAGNDIVVDDPAVAALHASISVVGNDYILEGGGEVAVEVNGTLQARRILQHGDVVELGAYSLKYVDARASSQIDLERTMLIPGLAPVLGKDAAGQKGQVPSSRASTARFPEGRVEWLGGPHRGSVRALDRVIATFGTPGVGVVVLTRRPHGFFATHVEGRQGARVNGEAIGGEPRALVSGDVIEVAGEKLRFTQP